MRLRLLDLDGSLMEQEPFRQAVAEGWAQSVDLRRDGPALRLWANASQRAALRHRLAELPPAVGDGIPVTFLGSGDFHHLSALMIIDAVEAVNLPITVIHFDNHPGLGSSPACLALRVLDQPPVGLPAHRADRYPRSLCARSRHSAVEDRQCRSPQ